MKKILLISCCILFSASTQAQVKTFNKYFGIHKVENYALLVTPYANDDIAAFAQANFGSVGDTTKTYLEFLRMNKDGDVLYLKKFNSKYSTGGTSAVATKDNGMIIFTKIILQIKRRAKYIGAALIKFDQNGNIEWSKLFKSQHYPHMRPCGIIETKDGNFAIHYNLSKDYLGGNVVGAMKVSPTGKLIWHKSYDLDVGFFEYYEGGSIVEGPNGKIIIGGSLLCPYDDCFIPYNGILMSFDANGKMEKHFRIPGKNENEFNIYQLFYNNQKLIIYGDYVFEVDLNSLHTLQGTSMRAPYFFLRKYPALRPTQFLNYSYLSDGSLAILYKYYVTSRHPYQIQVVKYDSLSRICPTYEEVPLYTDTSTKKFQVEKLIAHYVKDTMAIEDLAFTEYTMDPVVTICEGYVPENFIAKTNKDQASPVSIYPNPVKDILHIKNLDARQNYQLSISNNMGYVFKQTMTNKANAYDWNLSGMKAGMYFLSIRSGEKNIRLIFMKE